MNTENERPAPRVVTGRIKVHPDGYGLSCPRMGRRTFTSTGAAAPRPWTAIGVEVEWWVGPRGLEGRVRSVLERGRGKITGQIVAVGHTLRFQPDDPRITEPVVLRGGGAPPRRAWP